MLGSKLHSVATEQATDAVLFWKRRSWKFRFFYCCLFVLGAERSRFRFSLFPFVADFRGHCFAVTWALDEIGWVLRPGFYQHAIFLFVLRFFKVYCLDHYKFFNWRQFPGYLSNLPFLDAFEDDKNPTSLTLRHLTRHGRRLLMFNVLLNVFDRVRKETAYFVPEQLSMTLNYGAPIPYKIGLIRSSNRSYFFPIPVSEGEGRALVYKKLSMFLNNSVGALCVHDGLFMEMSRLLVGDASNFTVTLANHYMQLGFKNRMFVHYRWRLRRRR